MKYKNLLEPFPVKLTTSSLFGRQVTSVKDLCPSELIIYEIPSAFSILKSSSKDYCQECLYPIKNKTATEKTAAEEAEETAANKTGLFGGIAKESRITCLDCRNQLFWLIL
jgi:hypothetical protein